MLKSKWNSYFSFEDAPIQTNVEPITADEIQEVTQNEIDVNNDIATLEENTEIVNELIEQNDEITEVVESSPASVTPEVVQEHNTRFLIALGRLGAGTNDLSNIKIGTESSSLPLQQLKVTQEGIIDTIKEFFAKIWNFIKDIFTKIIDWFKNLFGVTKKKEDKIASVDNQIKKAGIDINKAKKEVDELLKDPEVEKIIKDAEKTTKEDTEKLLKEKLSKPGKTGKLTWKDDSKTEDSKTEDSKTEDSNVIKKAEAVTSFASYLVSNPLANNTINLLLAIFGKKIDLKAIIEYGFSICKMYELMGNLDNDLANVLNDKAFNGRENHIGHYVEKLMDNTLYKNLDKVFKIPVDSSGVVYVSNFNLDTREPTIEIMRMSKSKDVEHSTMNIKDKLKQIDSMYNIMVTTDPTFIQDVIKMAKNNQFSNTIKRLSEAAERGRKFDEKKWIDSALKNADANKADEQKINAIKKRGREITAIYKLVINHSKFVTSVINTILNCEQYALKMVIEL